MPQVHKAKDAEVTMSGATDFQPNPKGLPTFTDTIDTEGALHGAFEIGRMKISNPALDNLISEVTAAGHALVGNDGDRATFTCFPGLGGAAITDSGEVGGAQAWEVAITHPAMGRGKGEVHTCETPGEVLAVLSTVSYG